MRKGSHLLFILILLLSTSGLKAQVTADFTANVTQGCSPLPVSFTDLSTSSNPIVFWEWTLANNNTSNLTNPSSIFSTPGFYNITLTVSDGVDTSTITKTSYIQVFEDPTANFTVSNAGGCAPLQVQFNDISTPGDTTITGWTWNFGDGVGTSNQSNPTYTYPLGTQSGQKTITLTVVDGHGCSNTISLPSVNVTPEPVASFTTSGPASACVPPLTVNFQNTSTGSGILSYAWDLGLGGGYNNFNTNPSQTYSATGTYNISLAVSDQYGCMDTVTLPDFVSIGNVTAGFTSDDTVCVGEPVTFTNTSIGGNTFTWNLGFGPPVNITTPIIAYFNPGTYTVTVTANPGSPCADQFSKTIYVEEVIADFTSTPSWACDLPVTVQYTNQSSSNATSWLYLFGNPPAGSTSPNPTNDFFAQGTYDDTLIVTSNAGCVDTLIKPANLVVDPVWARFNPSTINDPDAMEGCAPHTINFTDTSYTPAGYPIVSWQWDFGDNTTSVLQNPTHTWANPGQYLVTLTITNSNGCDSTFSDIVKVGTKPVADFTTNTDTTCASDPVPFFDLSQPDSLLTDWVWSFSDGGGATAQNPMHLFSDTGWMDVGLVVEYNGCKDTVQYDSLVYVLGPIAYISMGIDCANPYDRQFTGSFLDVDQFYWDFGDNSPIDSVNVNPVHTYGTRDTFFINLTTYNISTGCSFDGDVTTFVTEPIAHFSVLDSVGCPGLISTFNAGASQDYEDCLSWNFGNGDSIPDILNDPTTSCPDTLESDTFELPGSYDVRLIITDINGCHDTAFREVQVFEPIADFTINSPPCLPAATNFVDQTQSDTNLVAWLWNFGDNSPTGLGQNPTHTYTQNGTYIVVMTAIDTFGCSNTVIDTLVITSPEALFDMDTTLCQGQTVFTTNSSIGTGLTYQWDFGDSSGTSAQQNPPYIYQDSGMFNVSLIITDSTGCMDTLIQPVQVHPTPQPAFTANPTDSFCYPMLTQFVDTSGSPYVTTWSWVFGDGGDTAQLTSPTAINTYSLPGVFDVTLILTTDFGCSNEVTYPNFINVKGPYASFSLQPDSLCVGEVAYFQVDTSINVFEYQWDFGTGTVATVPGTQDTISHPYEKRGVITVTLLFEDTAGLCPKFALDTIYVDEVTAAFDILPDSIGCLPLDATFQNTSLNASSWLWTLDNNQTSTDLSPTQNFSNPGTYDIKLLAINDTTGCRDSLIRELVVHPLPEITLTDDDNLCLGDSLQLLATGGLTYAWSPSVGLSNPNIANPVAKPDSTTDYTVLVTDSNGCEKQGSLNLSVQQPPALSLPPDTTIIIGEIVDILTFANGNYTYTWTPSTGLSCTNCPSPSAQPLVSTTYTVLVKDENDCFEVEYRFTIDVTEAYSLDLPSAFTPNGDGINDLLFIQGWGIKELLEFKVFNRWGQVVFESRDINQGWDGTFRGEDQNMDTYTYIVRVKSYDDRELSKTGYISLMR